MKEKEFKELLQQIENNTFVGNKLKISGQGYFEEGTKLPEALTDENAVALANALKKNPNIKIIELTFNNIGDMGATALGTLNELEHLNLYGNNITVKGATVLAQGNLKALTLADNAITYNRYYENIDSYSQPYATSSEMQEMINAFISNKTITYLGFNNCYFFDQHDEIIAQLIGNNTTIERLNLDSNRLTDEVLKYIGNNVTLEKLYLECNNITNTGVQYISQNHSLKEIDFGENVNINETSGKLLATHSTLKSVRLNKIDITIEKLQEIYSVVNSDSINQDIDLSGDMSYNIDDNNL